MNVSTIKSQVRKILDYNTTASSESGFTDSDTLELDTIIESQIVPAARHMTLIAPNEYVKWTDALAATYSTDHYEISITDKVLRVGEVKMENWAVPVVQVTDISSKEYRRTGSEVEGLKPSILRPMVAMRTNSDGVVLELWGGESGDYLDYAEYCTEPSISTGSIDVATGMETPLCYAVAAYTAEALKDTQKSNELLSTAYALLGVQTTATQQSATE